MRRCKTAGNGDSIKKILKSRQPSQSKLRHVEVYSKIGISQRPLKPYKIPRTSKNTVPVSDEKTEDKTNAIQSQTNPKEGNLEVESIGGVNGGVVEAKLETVLESLSPQESEDVLHGPGDSDSTSSTDANKYLQSESPPLSLAKSPESPLASTSGNQVLTDPSDGALNEPISPSINAGGSEVGMDPWLLTEDAALSDQNENWESDHSEDLDAKSPSPQGF